MDKLYATVNGGTIDKGGGVGWSTHSITEQITTCLFYSPIWCLELTAYQPPTPAMHHAIARRTYHSLNRANNKRIAWLSHISHLYSMFVEHKLTSCARWQAHYPYLYISRVGWRQPFRSPILFSWQFLCGAVGECVEIIVEWAYGSNEEGPQLYTNLPWHGSNEETTRNSSNWQRRS